MGEILVCRRKHCRRRILAALVRNLVCVDINGCRFLATVGPWDTKEYSLGHSYPMQGTLGRKDRNQRTQDPFWNHGHHPLERKPHGPIIEFLFLQLDRLCRLTSMQIGATGPRTQGTKETLGEHRDLGRRSGSRMFGYCNIRSALPS